MIRLATAVLLGLAIACGRAAAQELPAAGLAAEAAGRWEDALTIYRRTVAAEPRRPDLWARISSIEVRLDRPAAALQAMDAALAIRPDDPKYLRDAAVLATWEGDYARAAGRYRSLIDLGHTDADTLLGLARVTAWSGATDEAVGAYRRYLAARPDEAGAWVELARAESWRGNYPAAKSAIESYRAHGGDRTVYQRELAQILTQAGRPTPALAIIDALLEREPEAIDLLATRPVALALQDRPGKAFDALAAVRRAHPEARETRVAGQTVRLHLGSTIQPSASFYSDSDDLRVQRYVPAAGTLILGSGTRVSAGFERTLLDAPIAGGLGRADAGTAQVDERWLGAGQRVGSVTLEGRIASAQADEHSLTPFEAGARVRASDTVSFGVAHAFDFFVVSPRTVELGLTQKRTRATLDWAPGLRGHVSADALVQKISDGNTRWEFTASPRAAVARREGYNLDAGAAVYLLGTTRDLPNGYYDPRRYENYAAQLFPYFKLSENAGVGMLLSAGVQRDASDAGFRFGGTASVEATAGIYRPWVVAARASATNNRRSESGAFRGFSASVSLTRRF